jgi:hypothetical protein
MDGPATLGISSTTPAYLRNVLIQPPKQIESPVETDALQCALAI